MKHTLEVMISEEELSQRVSELAEKISAHYKNIDGELVLVGLLKGSFIFMADLCRKIEVPHEVDFMTVSSYGNAMNSSRDVKIVKDLDEDIRDKHVLIVEDIIDSGNTLNKVREIFELRGPKSVAICTLLDKPSRRGGSTCRVDWIFNRRQICCWVWYRLCTTISSFTLYWSCHAD